MILFDILKRLSRKTLAAEKNTMQQHKALLYKEILKTEIIKVQTVSLVNTIANTVNQVQEERRDRRATH